jgi:hypothetical protein
MGVGDDEAGLPLPQLASAQVEGAISGASAACTISFVALCASDSAPCGSKPPTVTAAITAASATRHLTGTTTEYGCLLNAS